MKPLLRSLCILLGVMLMLGTFAGCDLVEPLLHAEGQPNDTAEHLQTEQAQTEQTSDIADEVQTLPMDTKESQTTDLITTQSEETTMREIVDLDDLSTMFTMLFADPDKNTVSFSTYPYVKSSGLSAIYIMEVTVENGEIYIFDTLYRQVSVSPPEIAFEWYGLTRFRDIVDERYIDKEIYDKIYSADEADVLNRIGDSEFCYVLERVEGRYDENIAVYRLDTFYYFVSYNDQGVIKRIHCSSIE